MKRMDNPDNYIMKTLPSILRKKIFDRNITQKELAEAIGVTQASISAYCNGTVRPSIRNLKKIATYFNIKASELLSSEDDIAKYTTSSNVERNEKFANELTKLVINSGMSQSVFAKEIGVSRQTANLYMHGQSYPKYEVFQKICALFDVQPSYFDVSSENSEKDNLVFFVEKIPKDENACPFSKKIICYMKNHKKIYYTCKFGGVCEIAQHRCLHLKEL